MLAGIAPTLLDQAFRSAPADTVGKVRLIFENARKTDISGLSTLRFPAYFDFTNSIRPPFSKAIQILIQTFPLAISNNYLAASLHSQAESHHSRIPTMAPYPSPHRSNLPKARCL